MENYFIEARKIARNYGYVKTIAAEINGKLMYLTEGEVRALQILAKRKAEETQDAFDKFCEEVIIYSNTRKRKSKYKMIFRKNGCFENEFECGFFDACANMVFEIL